MSRLILSTLLLLTLAEAGARLAEWIHPRAEDLTFEYAPYRMLKMVKAPWPLNHDGFRAAELSTYRGGFLIEFLGGSVCLGIGSNTGPTLPERLESALHRAGLERARVLNLCQGGATSAQELAIFLHYGLPLAPQVVLSFDGANDLLHPRPIGDDPEANLPYRDAQIRARVNGQDALGHLAVLRVLERIVNRNAVPAAETVASPSEQEILDSYLQSVSAVRTLQEARGGAYALLFQPTLHFDKPWSVSEQTMWRTRRPRDGAPLTKIIHDRYADARAAVSGMPLYDLTAVFSSTAETVYSDSVHFDGPLGYQMLFSALERQGLVARIAAQYRSWEHSRL